MLTVRRKHVKVIIEIKEEFRRNFPSSSSKIKGFKSDKISKKNKTTGKWEFDYKDLKGKRKIKKASNESRSRKAQTKIYEDLNKGLNPVDTKVTLKEAGELYMRLHVSTNCKPSTIATNRGYLDNHIYPFFGDMKLCEITPILVKEFRKAMLDKGRKNSTVNKYMVFLGSIFNFMIDNDVPVRNPLARIKNLKVAKNEKIRALSTVEVQALLSKTKTIYPDFYPLLFTAIFTGMRKGKYWL